MRSSIACIAIAIAIGFHALFSKVEPAWVPRAIATAFLLLAIVVVVLAERRAAAVMRPLDPHVVKTADPINLRLFAGIIVLGGLALIGAIWILRFG
jgi:putative membrane protein